jgi:hypothetical protein
MTRLVLTCAILIGIGATAHAQFYRTTPNVMGAPQFGSTTTDNYGNTWRTTPNVMGNPNFGSTTVGPNGQSCQTTMNVMGAPQFGYTTHCF